MAEIDMQRRYFVHTLRNAQGDLRGLAGREHDQLVKVITLFTTLEKLQTYLAHIDPNQPYMDLLERAPRDLEGGSEDVSLGTYVEATVEELLPALRFYDVTIW